MPGRTWTAPPPSGRATNGRRASTLSGDLALVMVQVYGEGLDRAADAAAAAHLAAIKKPTSAAFLQETVWAARAGNRKQARIAGEQALELAAPADRDRVRAGIQQSLGNAP